MTFRTTPETPQNRPQEEWFCDPDECPAEPLQRICQTSIFRDELIGALSTDMGEFQRGDFINKTIGFTELGAVERRSFAYLSALHPRESNLQKSYELLRGKIADLTAQTSELRANAQSMMRSESAQQDLIPNPMTQDFVSGTRNKLTKVRRECENLERLKARWVATSGLDSRLQILDAESANLADELDRIGMNIGEIESVLRATDVQLMEIRARDPIVASIAMLREHGDRIGLRQGRCPLCNSEISLEKFEQHLQDLAHEISSAHQRVGEITEQQASASTNLQKARAQAARVQVDRDRKISEKAAINSSLNQLREELKTLDIEPNESSIELKIREKKIELSQIERDFAVAEASISLERVTEIERTRESMENEADQIEKRLQVMQRATATAEKVSATVKRLSRELLEERVATLNPLLSELYFRLRPHVDYTDVKYRMRGEVRRLLRLEVGNELNPRFMFSSGQRRALGLAFLLAVHLSRPWCRFRSLILDDAIQHVDDYRALHLVEVLSSIRQRGQQIICTVEDVALAELLCRRLRATDSGRGLKVTMKYESGSGVTVNNVERLGPLPKNVLLSA
ncbi:MAG TPA: hypothetical protein VGK22_23750 [Candidatus Angelobacter sp.]